MNAARNRLNLRIKATITMIAIVAFVLVGAVTAAYISTRQTMVDEYMRTAETIARGLADRIEVPIQTGDRDEIQRVTEVEYRTCQLDYVIIRGKSGNIVASIGNADESAGAIATGSSGRERPFVGQAAIQSYESKDDDFEPLAAQPPPTGGVLTQLGTVEIGLPAAPLEASLAERRSTFGVLIGGACVVIAGLVWLVVGRWTQRLDRLVTASEKVARGELDSPFDTSDEDEIGRLASSLDNMRLAVRQRDAAMRQFNSTLQDQVRDRTKDLEYALQAAEAANRAKSDFLANMSHEIRTPMTAILGYAELLSDPLQPIGERLESIRTILRSGEHLLGIVNDVLDISKIEAGQMTIERIPCSPVRVIEDATSLMRARASSKGLALDVVYETGIPETIFSDPLRLRQVLLNILGNAVKFTERGTITLRASSDPARRQLTLEVEDTGIGIPSEHLDRLFKPFSQSDNSMTRRFGGTGLGLAISERLMQMLAGSIRVKSTPGEGSKFSIVLDTGPIDGVPLVVGTSNANPQSAPARAADLSLRGLRILVVDDGVDNQRLVSFHLRKANAEVEIRENGRLGLEAAIAAAEAHTPYDVIVMDMQMPEMDGYTATRELRLRGLDVPVIALTAHALAGDREKCIGAGCDDYLTKPVDRTALIATCAAWSAKRRKNAA
ncbi:MAG: response regulator [Phycisphaerales bacterium]|nr:response regulator [Phycisphaerales bacterium]